MQLTTTRLLELRQNRVDCCCADVVSYSHFVSTVFRFSGHLREKAVGVGKLSCCLHLNPRSLFLRSTFTRRPLTNLARGKAACVLATGTMSTHNGMFSPYRATRPKLTWVSWRNSLPAGVRRKVVPPRRPLVLE